MHLGIWTKSELLGFTLAEIIHDVRRAWGVDIAVGVLRREPAPNEVELLLYCDVPNAVQAGELGHPPIVMVPMVDARVASLEQQLVWTVAGWCDLMMEGLGGRVPAP